MTEGDTTQPSEPTVGPPQFSGEDDGPEGNKRADLLVPPTLAGGPGEDDPSATQPAPPAGYESAAAPLVAEDAPNGIAAGEYSMHPAHADAAEPDHPTEEEHSSPQYELSQSDPFVKRPGEENYVEDEHKAKAMAYAAYTPRTLAAMTREDLPELSALGRMDLVERTKRSIASHEQWADKREDAAADEYDLEHGKMLSPEKMEKHEAALWEGITTTIEVLQMQISELQKTREMKKSMTDLPEAESATDKTLGQTEIGGFDIGNFSEQSRL